MRANELAEIMSRSAEHVANYLLPNGKRKGREWEVGSLSGEPGKSLKVCIEGEKAGVWCDFASGDTGDLLGLWIKVKGLTLPQAMRDAADFVGVRLPVDDLPEKPLPKLEPEKTGGDSEYLGLRGITPETQKAYEVSQAGSEVIFPSLVDGELVWCKFRNTEDKSKMRVQKGGAPVLFGWQAIPNDSRSVIITEGEIDALSWYELGYPALSVPNGAQGFNWIENEYQRLDAFDDIYIAFDADKAGRGGALELASRLGQERCLIVDTGNFKDANEVLLEGRTGKEFIDRAKPLDPHELKNAQDFYQNVIDLRGGKVEPGYDSPFVRLSGRLRYRYSELSVINGVNGHGKSQLIGQTILSAMAQGERVCIYSGEMPPGRLLDRMTKQAHGQSQSTTNEIHQIFKWFGERMWLFDLVGTAKTDRLLKVFEYAHRRYGVRVFVIDSLLKCGIGEDDYNGQKLFMERIADFKNQYPVHVHLVTHSRKGESEIKPTGKMDVRGSSSITDLADTVLTIWRNKGKEEEINAMKMNNLDIPDEVKSKFDGMLFCRKQRNGEWEGQIGLYWHPPSNQFLEKDRPYPYEFLQVASDEF